MIVIDIEKPYLKEEELNVLFQKGLQEYRAGDFYAAHEIWEEMWRFLQVKDRRFIQGLIQLSASFIKIQTGNLRRARSLLEKSQNKFEHFKGIHRDINIDQLKQGLVIIE